MTASHIDSHYARTAAPHEARPALEGDIEVTPGVWYGMGFGGHGMNTTTMAGEMLAGAIAGGADRYRLLAPFGLTPVFGPLGAAAAQLKYWYFQTRDALRG